jgi:hypothetical protein
VTAFLALLNWEQIFFGKVARQSKLFSMQVEPQGLPLLHFDILPGNASPGCFTRN